MSTWRGHLLRQKRDKLVKERLMMRMSNNLANTDELRGIIGMVMREAVSLIDADRAVLFLYNKDRKHLYTLSGLGLNTVAKVRKVTTRDSLLSQDEDDKELLDAITESRPVTQAGLESESFLSRKIVNVADAYSDDRFQDEDRRKDRHEGYKTVQILCAPVCIDRISDPVGVLRVVNNRAFAGPFSSDSEDMIMAFCSQIARAVVGVMKARQECTIKIERFLQRYQNSKMARAFQSWLIVYMQARRLRNMQKRAIGMFKNRSLARAMMSWISFLETRRRQRELTKRIIGRFMSNLLHRGFQTWYRYILRMKMTSNADDLYGRLLQHL